MVAKWGLGLLGALLGNTGGAGTAQAAASVLTGGDFLKFSRAEEREADEVGMTILTRSGWSGRGMVELFQMLAREASRDQAASMPSSRAIHRRRIASTISQPQVKRQTGGTRDSERYRSVKAHLARVTTSRSGDNR